jgi:hypothetical protein
LNLLEGQMLYSSETGVSQVVGVVGERILVELGCLKVGAF